MEANFFGVAGLSSLGLYGVYVVVYVSLWESFLREEFVGTCFEFRHVHNYSL